MLNGNVESVWLGTTNLNILKWYYDQKITFFGFRNFFTKHFPSEILALFSTRLFISTAIFRFNSPPLLHQKGYNDVFHSTALECSAFESALFSMQQGSFELSDVQTRVLHNL